jgi:pimeloyl-ACP methyl ester carboxylesterase
MPLDLDFDVYGQPGAPVLVLLHALGDDRSTWEGVGTAFAATHRLYAPDLRGSGRSPWPGEYSFELIRDDVLAFVAQHGLGDVTLVGHSMGGTVAWLVAEERPAWLARLVLEDTAPPRAPETPRPIPDRPIELPLTLDWALIVSLLKQLNEPDPAWWERTAQISVPTLVIAGGPDSHVRQDALAEVATRVADGRLVTIPAGHHVHRERPAEFLDALRSFLG